MNDWANDSLSSKPGPGSLLLLMGVALGAAAAFLLGTIPGRQVRRQISERTRDWSAQAADALVQNREKLIVSVEQQHIANPTTGPVHEKPF